MRGTFQLIGRLRSGESLDSLLERSDFTEAAPSRVFQAIIGRPPCDHDANAGFVAGDARTTFRNALMSVEFRERVIYAFLNAYPELGRDIFIHVPKCAGTDFIMNVGQRMMPLPHMLRFPDWLGDEEFLAVLAGLVQAAPFHDRIFVYGHMNLGEFLSECPIRPIDKAFSIIRDPFALMVSQANYAIGRLRADPKGRDPDTAETLSRLGIPRLGDDLTDRDLKDLVVRALFDPEIALTNTACRHLGPAGSERFVDTLAHIAVNDVEITTIRFYERWLKERWGIDGSERHNRSEPLLTEHEGRRLYSLALLNSTSEDLKLFNLVTWGIEKSGSCSVTGRQIARLTSPRSPTEVTDELNKHQRENLIGGVKGLFVVHDADIVYRYLQLPSVAVPESPSIEEALSLSFGRACSGTSYLGAGWSVPEDDFTWTNGKESILSLPPCTNVGATVVRMMGRPFIVDELLLSQDITIFVNGECIGLCTIHDVCLIEFEIPPAMAMSGLMLEVRLVVPGAMRPNMLKGISDSRVLGFCLEKLTVTVIGQRSPHDKIYDEESARP